MRENTSLRDQFLLRPDVVFLNHGSFGACPQPVFKQYQEWQLELERQPVEFLARERKFPGRMQHARSCLADFLGTGGDKLVFVPNATTGLNIVARSLHLEPGDEILTTDHEYGALDRTWTFICEKTGARYRRQQVPIPVESREQVVEEIWSGVTDKTRVLFLSHLTSATALVLPIAPLIKRARAAGITTVIDGAHGPGQVELDLETLGADYYVGNCHKWLLSPKGAAFLYARPEAQSVLEPLIVSFGWHSDNPGPSRFVDEHEYTGTRDIAAYLSVPAAIEFRKHHDWPTVQQSCHELVRFARQQIEQRVGLTPLCPDHDHWYGQMASLQLPSVDATGLQTVLRQKYNLEIPIIEWNQRQLIRVSGQAYNTEQDMKILVAALCDELAV